VNCAVLSYTVIGVGDCTIVEGFRLKRIGGKKDGIIGNFTMCTYVSMSRVNERMDLHWKIGAVGTHSVAAVAVDDEAKKTVWK
jgi:hypothetical protein